MTIVFAIVNHCYVIQVLMIYSIVLSTWLRVIIIASMLRAIFASNRDVIFRVRSIQVSFLPLCRSSGRFLSFVNKMLKNLLLSKSLNWGFITAGIRESLDSD